MNKEIENFSTMILVWNDDKEEKFGNCYYLRKTFNDEKEKLI